MEKKLEAIFAPVENAVKKQKNKKKKTMQRCRLLLVSNQQSYRI